MIDMLGREQVEYMINDKDLWSYSQKEYENMIQEWYKYIVEKKALIEKMSDKNGQDIENMEF
jgi:hypothetical protein